METKQKTTLIQGSVAKGMLLFALPIFISNLFQQLYNAADSLIVGNFLGGEALAAVGSSGSLIFLLTGFVNGVSLGAGVVVARYFGAKDWDRMRRTIHTTVALGIAAGVALTVVGVILTPQILRWMGTPDSVLANSIAYFRMYFFGSIAVVMYNVGASILQSVGDSKSPMCFIATACAANIALDYLFMGVLHLGPAGAALGTTLSQAISVVVSLTVILKRRSIVLKKSDFKPCRAVMGKILGIGIPIAFQDGLIQVAFIIITIIANQRGLNDAAAVGIVEKVISFLFLVPSSMLSTVSALGAQNIGAGKPERAIQTLRYAVMLAAGFGVLASIAIQFTAEGIVSLFTDPSTADGAAVVRFGGQYLRGYIFDCIFAGIHFSFSGFFCACRKSGLSFLHNILAIVLMRVPGVYVTSKLFPATLLPMGLATAAGSLLSVVICLIAFGVIRRKSTLVLVEE